MYPDEEGRLFNESIENGIESLVDRVHYTTGGAFGENGHSVLVAECDKCCDLRRSMRDALAKEIL